MNYLARIEKVVTDNLSGDVIVLGAIFNAGLSTEREGYWERVYHVAWTNGKESGTHQANINSNDDAMLVYGHYQLTEVDAVHDMIERAGLSVGRI